MFGEVQIIESDVANKLVSEIFNSWTEAVKNWERTGRRPL